MLSDQLRNVGSPVNNHHLVLQLISGLPEAYRSVATLIRQSNPLPSFYQARYMTTLEEAGMDKMESISSHYVMHTTQQRPSEDTSQRSRCRPGNRSRSRGNQGRGGGHGHRSGPQFGAPSALPSWPSPTW
ncbi:polynucleotidyl transferase [Trifolium medium]|uniref:Polynucleotidyl transferase n=1 Tax=Trifolium medium TaxID=97028 RepID=A0A392NU63_9FABA|nr:polynucleotidyl transferase [Trifolium medium]